MTDQFYKTQRWTRLREKILRRDEYRCTECRRYGKAVQGTTVHHIFPREDFPEIRWEPWNLTTLCPECHNAMHDRNTNKLTDRGMALVYRVARSKELSEEMLNKVSNRAD